MSGASEVDKKAFEASCRVEWAELGGVCYHDYTAACVWLSLLPPSCAAVQGCVWVYARGFVTNAFSEARLDGILAATGVSRR